MNPLQQLRDLVAPPAAPTNGTVVGQMGDRVQVRTSDGIKFIATDKITTLGANVSFNEKGEVSGVLDTADLIPTYKV